MREEHCETWIAHGQECGKPAVYRYPAMGGGFHHMCEEHGEKHAPYSDRKTAQGWEINERIRTWPHRAPEAPHG